MPYHYDPRRKGGRHSDRLRQWIIPDFFKLVADQHEMDKDSQTKHIIDIKSPSFMLTGKAAVIPKDQGDQGDHKEPGSQLDKSMILHIQSVIEEDSIRISIRGEILLGEHNVGELSRIRFKVGPGGRWERNTVPKLDEVKLDTAVFEFKDIYIKSDKPVPKGFASVSFLVMTEKPSIPEPKDETVLDKLKALEEEVKGLRVELQKLSGDVTRVFVGLGLIAAPSSGKLLEKGSGTNMEELQRMMISTHM